VEQSEVPLGVRRGARTAIRDAELRRLCGLEACVEPDSLGSVPVKNSACIPCGWAALAVAIFQARCHPGRPRIAKPKNKSINSV
jgi:hypothetical protein